MLKKTIKFEGLDGEETSEEFHFHLSKANLLEMDMEAEGGFEKMMGKIIDAEDNHAIYNEFKKILLFAVGKKSDDGKRFIKSKEIRDDFETSEAFSELILELLGNADSATQFINGLLPKSVAEGAAAAEDTIPKFATEPDLAVTKPEIKILTHADMIGMDAGDLKSGLAEGRYQIGPSELT